MAGVLIVRFGVALLDAYLEFLAVRSRPDTVAAVAYDLEVFVTVVGTAPGRVVAADVLAFVTAQYVDVIPGSGPRGGAGAQACTHFGLDLPSSCGAVVRELLFSASLPSSNIGRLPSLMLPALGCGSHRFVGGNECARHLSGPAG